MVTPGLPALAAAGGVQIARYQISGQIMEGAVVFALLFLGYWLLSSRRVRGHMRRLGLSLAVAALLCAVGVGYADHTYHGKLAAAPGRMPVVQMLAYTWGAGTIVLTVLLFVASTMFVRSRGGLSPAPVRVSRRQARRGRRAAPEQIGMRGMGGMGGMGGVPWDPR